MKNPFKFGKEVSGYQFYDRQEATHSLLRKLRDGSTNVVLFAPRRYGKTSLVLKVIEQLSRTDGICGLCFDMTRVPFDEAYRNRHRLPVTSTLHTALCELVDAGLVDRTPTVVRLADPLFARSIRGNSATVFTA